MKKEVASLIQHSSFSIQRSEVGRLGDGHERLRDGVGDGATEFGENPHDRLHLSQPLSESA